MTNRKVFVQQRKTMPEAVVCATVWYNAARNNLSDCMRLRNKFNDNRFLSFGTKELNKARAHLKREVNEWARRIGAVTYQPPADSYLPHFITTINDIPCGIVVECFDRDIYGVDFQYFVIDRKGYRADWLASKIDGGTEDRIYREFCKIREENEEEREL